MAVTIEVLSDLKRISVADLRSYGLTNVPEGVRFSYHFPDGRAGKARLRVALRGADGSKWSAIANEPITAYIAPPNHAFHNSAEMIVVEGESDCWTAWTHGVRTLGIPGSDQTMVLSQDHLDGVRTVYIQRERLDGPNRTFPKGVDHFVDEISDRLVQIGFDGVIRILRMPDPFSDLSDMHVADPASFDERLATARVNSILHPRSL
ncbi:hypothetical protein QA649_02605 [Bradyrhizobium sp. CB1717]|uniref:hypothetical protein n=1 Tax=Bradyrhizobium sp. CB1717 TaxID=3039154 RepID=UPI0024B2039A|nr:hypothetical protein [Bradyrhizobium sp. CB1717]WFU25156.1 hypothetical protein QA649_02605 [Bradyrhizobium sp. CB1717]